MKAIKNNFSILPAIDNISLNDFLILYREAFPDGHLSKYSFKQYMDLFPSLFLIAKFETNPAAYIIGGFSNNNEGWILSVGTSPIHRGKGIAKILLLEIVRKFKKQNINKILLTVSTNNTSAINLFQNVGFKIEANKIDYYEDGVLKYIGVYER